MKTYSINKLDNNNYQIYGEINGFMVRNNNGAENLNHFNFYFHYFVGSKQVKVSGVCKNIDHLKSKLEKESDFIADLEKQLNGEGK